MKNRYNINKIILQRRTDFSAIALKKHIYRGGMPYWTASWLKARGRSEKVRGSGYVFVQGAVSNVKICGDSNREIIVSCVYYLI